MRIELLKPHIHMGQVFTPGETLDLLDDAARWLIEAGVARAADEAPKTPAPASDKSKRKE